MIAILIPGLSRAARSIVVQPRAIDCHGAALQVVSETHSRPDPPRAAVSVRHQRLSPGQPDGRQNEGYGILLKATDAARRQGLNVVLCGDRLFQQYVLDACAKMERQQLLNYLRFNQNSPALLPQLTLFWRMTEIAPVVVCAILSIFCMSAIKHEEHILLYIIL